MSENRLIKRYSNRKLYDTKQSSYITLEQIRSLTDGDTLTVIEKDSKEDITAMTICSAAILDEDLRKAMTKYIQNKNIESLTVLIDSLSGDTQNTGGLNE